VSVGVVDLLEVVDVGNARVRGFQDWRDDEPGRLPTVGGALFAWFLLDRTSLLFGHYCVHSYA
jgi:hypothetical protein